MADAEQAEIEVSLIDDTGPGAASVNKNLQSIDDKGGETADNVGKSLESIGSKMKQVGSTLSTYVTLPIVGIAVTSSVMAAKFQQNMELLHTEAGVPQAALAGLSKSILDMAGQVGQGPEALAEAMYHIASNAKGVLTSAQMLDQLRISAEAASMTGASLDDTTYTLSSTLASGISGAKGYADMMGVLNGIVGAGDMRFQDLNAAIGTGFLATGSQFGITIQSMGAALATLTDNGESADEAATRLRMSVTLMSAPSAQAAKILGALGLSGSEVKASTDAATQALADAHVTTTQLADDMRKPDGINVALLDLQSHLEKSGLSADAADAAIAKAFGGGRSDAAILTLLNNTKRTGEAFDQINKSSGDFQKLWNDQQQTPMQKFKDSMASIQASMTKLGNDILPAVVPWFSKISGAVGDVANWFDKLNLGQRQWVLGFALGAAALGPLLVLFGTLAGAIGNIIVLTGLMGPAFTFFGNIGAGVFNGLLANIGLTGGAMANLRMLMMTPIPLVVVAAAALAILATVAQKAGEVRSAMDGLTKSEGQFNQVSSSLAAAAAKLPNGPEKTRMLAIANQPAPSVPSGNIVTNSILGSWLGLAGYATGGMVPGPTGAAQLAVVHGGEVVTPPGERFGGNANSVGSMPGSSGGASVTIQNVNIYNQMDEETFLRDVAWRLSLAN